MSAQPVNQAPPDQVNIEINGLALQVPKGSMIIHAADKAGIPIPRFCYHRKLPIAANCRMCLVEVEMGGRPMPKPQPACATPVGEGMKVFTRTEGALKAQRNVMEFLLINHPLDCPICDQGGECELQDISLGYGRGVSRYVERKRTVADENLGPLVATEMTRCIQCTRCVRFTSEIAGSYELGGINRGDNLQIGTYIGKTVETELSGNIIDVCPVGALTNKVFKFQARAWELIARPSIGYHDALGSNLWLHTRRGAVLRTVPRDNESINECWLSDRDRYSHQGLQSADRLAQPRLKRDGLWVDVSWEEALNTAAGILRKAGPELGVLVNPASTCEEGELLRRLATGLGTAHLDHRLRQLDLADAPLARRFAVPVAEVPKVKAALLVGSDLRYELPLLNHRLHQAWKQGARIFAVNPAAYHFNYDLAGAAVVAPQHLVDTLLGFAAAAAELGAGVPAPLQQALSGVEPDELARTAVKALQAGPAVIILGEAAVLHPQASWLRALADFIATATGAGIDELPVGANAIGLAAQGVLPAAGGLSACTMLTQPRQGYLLYGVEPALDLPNGEQTLRGLRAAGQVVAFTAFASEDLLEVAQVLLPIGLLPEIDGRLVNVDGQVQTVEAAATLPGETRPGWKVLRALGAQLGLEGFAFDDLAGLGAGETPPSAVAGSGLSGRPAPVEGLVRLASWPIYRCDAVLRRAAALQAHPLTRPAEVRLNPEDAAERDIREGDPLRVADAVVLPARLDPAVPRDAVWIESGHADTASLPPYGAAITLSKA
ncbi:NADH-quinone oxidoreductase subunit NuoG [Frateuria aurantia]|uniref:NADH-quinone oxidoreductase n=1 Tax=Frateuria aurantia (strain ATCC 33424 / DSM 6220 / KCTC 2777 / LMG 1558 / NBRC 3245 / NCIMB 13370) TaxID=767434 RepID=H8L5U3_FRAAD|nr:NADH-quinone oxidoreductase subunit NuoG [Frateuria aurantia]AFC85843.1 NADH-quinone oxidoreductase, chain G [Frateuria aurantia DSM 6220]